MLSLEIDDTRARNWLRRIPGKVNQHCKEGLNQFGQILVQRLLQQARIVGIHQFRANMSMFTNTRYEQHGGEGVVKMPMSGAYQDSALPHFVTISKKHPMLLAWARRNNYKGRVLFFRPKPFIKVGVQNAKQALSPIMRNKVHIGIAEAH